MFHRVDDASKVALVRLLEHLRAGGFALFDTQLWTPHLGSLGAVELERSLFLDLLAVASPGQW
jgi:leucyl/phenylalanyl-tRNA--protein transferase